LRLKQKRPLKLIKKAADSQSGSGKKLFVSCVIVAAGSSDRMGGQDKIFSELDGMPVLAYSLRTLSSSSCINELIVVTRRDKLEEAAGLCRLYAQNKAAGVVAGGKTRAESALAGVMAASRKARLIAIHDGARPLVTEEVINEAVKKAAVCGAAVAAVPVIDTIKTVCDGKIEETPPRSGLFAAQTPQVFDAELIKAALTYTIEKGIAVTDDSEAVERLGFKPAVTAGDRQNIKITVPEDLSTALAIISRRNTK